MVGLTAKFTSNRDILHISARESSTHSNSSPTINEANTCKRKQDPCINLKELVLLALGAKAGDEDCMHRLGSALDSEQTVAGIVDFFSGEFEVE
ncbi:hypothetical protein N0V86_002124 [Didymella sp. IMI 355093]|nr:hypothetical protein N0V86_002124 [Didymella sp. IMI 355093]